MSGSLNRTELIGHLGADVELRYTPNGNRPVASMRVATTEVWKDKAGQKQEATEWHRCTIWGEQAENCAKYLSKGSQVYVEGKLQTRSWDDKDGQKRYSTEIVASRVLFLGSKGGGKREGGGGGERKWGDGESAGGEDMGPPPGDDDIPF